MRLLSILLLILNFANAQWELKGNIGFEHKAYLDKQKNKDSSNSAFIGEVEATYDGDIYSRVLVKTLKDFGEKSRKYIRVDEAFVKFMGDDDELTIGKSLNFWGSLEVINLVDILNQQDNLRDIFDKEYKKGSYLANYSYYFDESQINFIVKMYEEEQKLNDKDSPYYFFPEFLNYSSQLKTTDSRYTPSLYLKYSGSLDLDTPIDYAFALMHGYDKKRYFEISESIKEVAFRVDKFLMWDTMVVDSTLLKLEASATHSKEKSIDDYFELGLGVEHTLEQIFSGNDLGLLVEYYRHSSNYETREKLNIFMQNDIFVGFRLSFNDVASSEIVGGGIFDLDYDEKNFYIEAKTRVFDTFILEADIRRILPAKESLLNFLGNHTRATVALKYYF